MNVFTPRGEGLCEFGLCAREAEFHLEFPSLEQPVYVCGLHVTPVIMWGVPEPEEPAIRALINRSWAA